MSRFVGSVVKSQNGSNQFCWCIETSVSDRTVTASFRIYAKGAYSPYYQWSHTVYCAVGGNVLINTTGQYPSSDAWKSCSVSINGTTYQRYYQLTSGSASVGDAGGTISCSFSYSVSGTATYLPVKGTYTASGSETIAAKTGSFNLNILNPDGSEPYTTGEAGSVEFSSNGGSTYTRLYNEPASSYLLGTSFKCRNFTPGTGRYLSSVSGFTSTSTSGPWSATQASSTTLNFYTSWNNYTLTINPNGGSYNGTTSNTTKTQAFNTTYTLLYPTRTGYLFSHWVASRGSNYDENGLKCNVYNNMGNGAVTHTWLQSESTSGTNGDVLKIVTNGTASPGAGGFYQAFTTKASHQYYQIYRLKVPTGYTVCYANNAMGDSPVVESLTDMAGTGGWKTYIFKLTTKSTGTFSTSGFVYLNGTNNTSVTWYVAQAQVWNITDNKYEANSNGIFRYDYSTSNCTLTAQWEPNRYTVVYNGNGSTGGSMSNSTHTYGTSKALTSNSFTRSGYTFKGWATSSTSTTVAYTNGQSVLNLTSTPNGTINLYAVWQKSAAYLDLNGWLDGAAADTISPHGTVNVTVGGATVATNVSDFHTEYNYGTTYQITNIQARSGYRYNGVHSGSISGTISESTTPVVLDFSTIAPSNLILDYSIDDADITFTWSADGLNITNYKLYINGSLIYNGSGHFYPYTGVKGQTYTVYFTATNVGGTTTSRTYTISLLEKARVYFKYEGHWEPGTVYYKKDGHWIEGKQIYRKISGMWYDGKNIS